MTRIEADSVVLALGGGAARGLAHIGVIEGLEEDGIRVAGIAGTSMGSLVGALYAQGLRAREIEGVFTAVDWTTLGRVFLGSVVGEAFHDLLREVLGEARIESLRIPFAAVCCDLDSGREVVLRRGSLADACRASAAIPGMLPPLRRDEGTLVDGAIVSPVPVEAARSLDSAPVLAVHVLRPARREAGSGSAAPPSMEGDAPRSLFARVERWLGRQRGAAGSGDADLPGRLEVLVRSLEIMEDRLALCGDRPAALVEPAVAGFGLFDFHRVEELVAAGYRAYREMVGGSETEDGRGETPEGRG